MSRYLDRPDVTVVCVCPGHADAFAALGVQDSMVVRNAAPLSRVPATFPDLPDNDTLVVVLVGSLYPGRGVEALIEGASRARADGVPVMVEITGRGTKAYLDGLRALVARLAADEFVSFLGSAHPAEVPKRYARAHVGTALYEPVDLANDSLSNKIFETLAAGRPVLAGNMSENTRLLAEVPAGWTTEVTPEGLHGSLCRIWADIESVEPLARLALSACRGSLNWDHEVQPVIDDVIRAVVQRSKKDVSR